MSQASETKQAAQNKQSVRGHILFFFAVALALYVAWLMRGVLALLYVSALFAVVLSPVVRATSRVRIGRWKPFHGSMAIFILLLAVAGASNGFRIPGASAGHQRPSVAHRRIAEPPAWNPGETSRCSVCRSH